MPGYRAAAWPGPRHALFEIVANTDLISFLPLLNDRGVSPPIARMLCADLKWRMPAGISFRENRPLTAAGQIVFEKLKQEFQISVLRADSLQPESTVRAAS